MVAEPSDPARPTADARAAWRAAIITTLGVRAAFLFVAWAGAWMFATTREVLRIGFFDIWSRWDATILLRIAEHGYTPLADPHATAFFPLYPLLVRGVSALGVTTLAAGIFVSTLGSVVAFAYLYRLAEEEIGPGSGRRAVLLLALFPTSVFLIAPYTESLFLAGAIPAFYYARRGRWGFAAFPAAVAMGARFAGVFLLAGLVVELIRQRRDGVIARGLFALAAGLIPLGAYMTYLAMNHGSATAFVAAQADGWGRRLSWPWDAFTATWNTNTGYATNWIFSWKIEIAVAIIGVALVLVAAARRQWPYATYMAGTLAVLLVSSWYMSIPRMLLSLFPIVLMAAALIRRVPRLHDVFVAAFAVSSTFGVIVFTRGIWFF